MRTTQGGQPWYSPQMIPTALAPRAVFRLALSQTKGLVGSIMGLLGLNLPVPDHTALSCRAATLQVPRRRILGQNTIGSTPPGSSISLLRNELSSNLSVHMEDEV